MMIGTCAVALSRRRRRQTSIPLVPSIIQSRMTRSGGLLGGEQQRLVAVGGDANVVAFALKRIFEQFGERGIVLDEQRARRLPASPRCHASVRARSAVAAGRGVIDHLGDVGGMVADPFEIAGDEQQVRGAC